MLDEITWGQFQEWVAFAELSPFLAEREDFRIASIVQTLANVNRDPKKRRTPYPIEDFVLRFGDAPKSTATKQSVEEQKNIGRQYYMLFNQSEKRL